MKNNKALFRIKIQRLHVFVNETDHFIAFDEEDCEKVYFEHYGEHRFVNEDITENPFIKIKGQEKIKIIVEDDDEAEKSMPVFADLIYEEDKYPVIVAPAWSWILYNGRGFLCSSEW